MSITRKQNDVLQYISENPYFTFNDVQKHFGFKSPNSVTQNLQSLVKKGLLKKEAWGYEITLLGAEKVSKLSEYDAGYYQAKIETVLTKKKASTILGISHSLFSRWEFEKEFSAYRLLKFLESTSRREYIEPLMTYLGVYQIYKSQRL